VGGDSGALFVGNGNNGAGGDANATSTTTEAGDGKASSAADAAGGAGGSSDFEGLGQTGGTGGKAVPEARRRPAGQAVPRRWRARLAAWAATVEVSSASVAPPAPAATPPPPARQPQVVQAACYRPQARAAESAGLVFSTGPMPRQAGQLATQARAVRRPQAV
jgi:hypothetical protein